MSIAALVSDAAPGEIDAVRRDIEVISKKNAKIERELAETVPKANIEQARVVTVDGKLEVLTKHNQLGPEKFVTAGSKPVEFEVDHLTRETKVLGPHEVPEEAVKTLSDLQKHVSAYAKQHYSGEFVSAVFHTDDEEFSIVIVGRRLSPQNFYNGQITAQYSFNTESGKLKGFISADVHFFEDGNVRLKSTAPVNSSAKVSTIAEVLKETENQFESNLNKTLTGLNEREFKSLRRQLPVTRQAMAWGPAVSGYKLGKELEKRE